MYSALSSGNTQPRVETLKSFTRLLVTVITGDTMMFNLRPRSDLRLIPSPAFGNWYEVCTMIYTDEWQIIRATPTPGVLAVRRDNPHGFLIELSNLK